MTVSKALKFAILGGVLLAIAAGQAQASPRLTVERNNMVRVSLPGSAASVIVSNPGVADVNVVDSHTVYVIGRGYGQSAVTILDRGGRAIYDSQVIVTSTPQDAVTVYHGNKPQIMVCANVCTDAGGDSSNNNGGDAGAAPPVIPVMSAPAAPAASPVAVTSPAATMAVSQ